MPSPSTHQDSPKVTYEAAINMVFQTIHAANPGQTVVVDRHHTERDGKWFTVTVKPYPTEVQDRELRKGYIPVSALLSDEAAEALARRHYATRSPSWDKLPAINKASLIANARLDLQAAIEQVGGGQGGG